VAVGYVQCGCEQQQSVGVVWCAGDSIVESLVICTAPHYCALRLTKEDKMVMGIWKVWGEERGKQDFGGYTGGKAAGWNIQARWDGAFEVGIEERMRWIQ